MVGHLANHGGINNRLHNHMEGPSPNDLNPDQGGQNFCLSCRNAPILICAINKPFGSCHTYLSGTFRLSRGGGNGKIWHPLEHSSAPKLLGDPILLLFLSVGNYWGHRQLRNDHPLWYIVPRERNWKYAGLAFPDPSLNLLVRPRCVGMKR